jgi:hypothetical protein
MEIYKSFQKLLIVLSSFLLIVSCGGGGGSSSGGSSGASGGSSGATISLVSPASIVDKMFAGSSGNGATVQFRYSGDSSSLNGKTVYVIASIPDSNLYQPNPTYSLNTSTQIFTLTLGGNLSGVAEGRYANTMKIYACLDTQCNQQLSGSPISIPYVVDTLPKLKLTPNALSLSTSFGTLLPPSQVSVTLPQGATDWTILNAQLGSNILVSKLNINTLQITPVLSQPGNYSSNLILQALAPDPMNPNTTLTLQTVFPITYGVTSSSVVVAMDPISASFSLVLNDPTQRSSSFNLLAQQEGGSLSMRGIVFYSNPVAANGHPEVNQWTAHSTGYGLNTYSIIPCGTIPGSPNCLPAGLYTSAIQYRYTDSSNLTTDFEFPITMTIN